MLEIKEKKSKLDLLESDAKNLASDFLQSRFWELYLYSKSFTEAVRLFLQVKHKISLSPSQQEQIRKVIMKEVAKVFESEALK